MKSPLALLTLAIVALPAAYVAFHPGRAYAEPRLASTSMTPLAQDATYSVDGTHSSISFEIRHLGLANVHGRINKFTGTIFENEKDLTKSRVEFTGQMETIDTAIAGRDRHLQSEGYFDVKNHPTMSFKSTKVAKTKTGYTVTGNLTIKGKTKSIMIPFKHYGPYKIKGEGFENEPTRIGVVADPVVIKRTDFGISNVEPLPDGTLGISDEVTVRISLEAIKE